MNENMRELNITPSMRQSQMLPNPSFEKDRRSSDFSHTTKGFMGNTPV